MPDWLRDAEWVERLSNSFLLIVTALVALFGVKKARPRHEPAGGRMEVAGALIDAKEAQALRAALDANTKALDRCTDATEGVEKAAERMERTMDHLKDEMIRGQYRR